MMSDNHAMEQLDRMLNGPAPTPALSARSQSVKRPLKPSANPGVATQHAEGAVTIAKLLDQPSALSGVLELYIPPTKKADEGVLVDRFFVLVHTSVHMFISRMSPGKPLGSMLLSRTSYIAESLQGAHDDLAFELLCEAPNGLVKSWILCAKTMSTKLLWVEMINHAISSCRSPPQSPGPSPSPMTANTTFSSLPRGHNSALAMTRSFSSQGVEGVPKVSSIYHEQHEGNLRLLSKQTGGVMDVDVGFLQPMDAAHDIVGLRRGSDSSVIPTVPASDGAPIYSPMNSNSSADESAFRLAANFGPQQQAASGSLHSGDSGDRQLMGNQSDGSGASLGAQQPGSKKVVRRRIRTAIMGVL